MEFPLNFNAICFLRICSRSGQSFPSSLFPLLFYFPLVFSYCHFFLFIFCTFETAERLRGRGTRRRPIYKMQFRAYELNFDGICTSKESSERESWVLEVFSGIVSIKCI